jgi:hypothetical protein
MINMSRRCVLTLVAFQGCLFVLLAALPTRASAHIGCIIRNRGTLVAYNYPHDKDEVCNGFGGGGGANCKWYQVTPCPDKDPCWINVCYSAPSMYCDNWVADPVFSGPVDLLPGQTSNVLWRDYCRTQDNPSDLDAFICDAQACPICPTAQTVFDTVLSQLLRDWRARLWVWQRTKILTCPPD